MGILDVFFGNSDEAEKPPKKQHEPLLKIDDRPIIGLKRCKHCGLSETYWERWPECE